MANFSSCPASSKSRFRKTSSVPSSAAVAANTAAINQMQGARVVRSSRRFRPRPAKGHEHRGIKSNAANNTIINIEEEGEFGIVDVASSNKDDIAAALKWIKDICTVPEVGDVYDAGVAEVERRANLFALPRGSNVTEGKVVSIVEFGAFMEFLPGKEGLMHISEYEWGHPATLEGLIKEGDEFQVKVIAFDEKSYHIGTQKRMKRGA